MRLIDADALLEREGATRLSVGGRGCGKTLLTACRNYFHTLVSNAPTIDAVPVVRKAVKGYEGYYEVDQFGRVFGLDRTITVVDGERTYEKPIAGRQLKQSMHDKGYKAEQNRNKRRENG